MTWPVFRGPIALRREVRAATMITGGPRGEVPGDIASALSAVRATAKPESELTHMPLTRLAGPGPG
jgi:hypothetical protein